MTIKQNNHNYEKEARRRAYILLTVFCCLFIMQINPVFSCLFGRLPRKLSSLIALLLFVLSIFIVYCFIKDKAALVSVLLKSPADKPSIEDLSQDEMSQKLESTVSNLISLQSQIHPHFLYNTLDSLRGELYMQALPQLAETVECLSDLFRYSINQSNSLISLNLELDNTYKYLKIMQFRFPNKFNLIQNFNHEDMQLLNIKVPRLMLQPIVENSIIHGLESKTGPGIIEISIIQTDKLLYVSVSDDGLGIQPEVLDTMNQNLSHNINPITEDISSGVALLNINSRIKLLYGNDYGINILSKLGVGTQVQIMLPFSGAME